MKGSYLLNLTDDTYKKLLIYIQYKVIYDDKNYFWKILTSIQMKPSTLKRFQRVSTQETPYSVQQNKITGTVHFRISQILFLSPVWLTS